jgi:hypothetical protein
MMDFPAARRFGKSRMDDLITVMPLGIKTNAGFLNTELCLFMQQLLAQGVAAEPVAA